MMINSMNTFTHMFHTTAAIFSHQRRKRNVFETMKAESFGRYRAILRGNTNQELIQKDYPNILVEKEILTLTFNDRDSVPPELSHLPGRVCSEVVTKADGACAVHAVFGRPCWNKLHLVAPRPRKILHTILDHSLSDIKSNLRPQYQTLATNIVSELWAGIVLPWLESSENIIPNEESMFLKKLRQSHLQKTVQKYVDMNKCARHKRDGLKEDCKKWSCCIFDKELKTTLWAKLASDERLITALDMEHRDKNDKEGSSTLDYESPPWFIRGCNKLVKGTSLAFESNTDGGPSTKFEALFDPRPEFNDIRIGFLLEVGGWKLQALDRAVQDLFASNKLQNEDVKARLRSYIGRFGEYFAEESSAISPPPNFAEEAWPLLVACICEENEDEQYYLSSNELLLVSELKKQNTVIFATANGSAEFMGSIVGHEGSGTVLVALQRHNARDTHRTHFQRLMLIEDLQEAAYEMPRPPHLYKLDKQEDREVQIIEAGERKRARKEKTFLCNYRSSCQVRCIASHSDEIINCGCVDSEKKALQALHREDCWPSNVTRKTLTI